MENTRRNAYDAALKLKAIDLAVEEGNKAAASKLGIPSRVTAVLLSLYCRVTSVLLPCNRRCSEKKAFI